MTQDQLKALAQEISANTAKLDYADFLQKGNDDGVAKLFNGTPATIALATIGKNSFLKYTAGAALRLAMSIGTDGNSLDPNTMKKWAALLKHAYAVDPGSQIELSILPLLGDPVKEMVMTQAEFDAMTTRPGTLAESLFGGPVNSIDVARAKEINAKAQGVNP